MPLYLKAHLHLQQTATFIIQQTQHHRFCVSTIRVFLLLVGITSFSAFGSIPVSGNFTASATCPAFQSFRKETNPDNIQLISNRRYEALSINKINEQWIQLRIPGASPAVRWVNKDCGTADFKLNSNAANNTKNPNSCQIPNDFDSYVLAVTWQPGFCEHANYKGRKPECNAINSGEKTISHLTLHGLWPNKRSCGINYGYCDSQATLNLSSATIKTISPWMPNFFYQNSFGEYQWKKHGACQNLNDDDYFLTAIDLVKKVNSSPIGLYIEQNIGKTVSVSEFKNQLTQTLGTNAVNRIRLSCSKGRYLTEVQLNLERDFNPSDNLLSQLERAPKSSRFQGNCNSLIHIEESGQ
ncbi:ribonuclease T2 family protein [Photobacterium profundum]|uniref:ribonuclease T2 family protein n=1 Tax=Photobacterium profundum TaxID=74109 RepID=UPI003D10F794